MKRIIYILLSLTVSVNFAKAQIVVTDTWTETANSITYRFDKTTMGTTKVYNVNNRFTYVDQVHRDGTPFPASLLNGTAQTTLDPNNMDKRAKELVDEAFSITGEDFMLVHGQTLFMELIIDPDTGMVMEVNFGYSRPTSFSQLSPQVFERMERALKMNIRYIVTAEGRKMNFCLYGWSHEVGKYSTPKYNPGGLPVLD